MACWAVPAAGLIIPAVTETGAGAAARPDGGGSADGIRERLVGAAAELIAEKGYEGAGVQEIARRAGLTTGAIYSRYSGKAELLADAIRATASPELEQLFATEAPVLSASELIRRAGSQLVTPRRSLNQALLLEAFVAARRDSEVAEVMREHLDRVRETFTRVIDFGRRNGDLDPGLDTEAVVHFCHAVALGFLVYETVGTSQPAPDAWSDLIGRLVDAIRDPLPEREESP